MIYTHALQPVGHERKRVFVPVHMAFSDTRKHSHTFPMCANTFRRKMWILNQAYFQIHIAREDFFPGGFGWAFPKGSPYRMKFDQLFQRLIEAGLIDKWMSDLIQLSASKKRDGPGNENETLRDRNGPKPFTVYHLQGVFFITIGGFGLAAVTFLIETMICKFNNTNQ